MGLVVDSGQVAAGRGVPKDPRRSMGSNLKTPHPMFSLQVIFKLTHRGWKVPSLGEGQPPKIPKPIDDTVFVSHRQTI